MRRGRRVGAVVRALKWEQLCGKVGTAVGAVVRTLMWEQKMWGGRDSCRCISEGTEVGTENAAR